MKFKCYVHSSPCLEITEHAISREQYCHPFERSLPYYDNFTAINLQAVLRIYFQRYMCLGREMESDDDDDDTDDHHAEEGHREEHGDDDDDDDELMMMCKRKFCFMKKLKEHLQVPGNDVSSDLSSKLLCE